MKRIEDEMPLLKSVMRLIAGQVGKHCEVVLHDWSKGYEHSVVAIENGEITGRGVGACGSNLGLEVMKGTVKNGDRYHYVTRTRDGRYLRSSTVYLRDDEGNPLGAMCINYDISELMQAKKAIEELSMADAPEGEYFATDVTELLDYLLTESVGRVGKPVPRMSREDKITALKFLDEKGAFMIAKAGVKACQFFGISKFSLYSYLEEARGQKQPDAAASKKGGEPFDECGKKAAGDGA